MAARPTHSIFAKVLVLYLLPTLLALGCFGLVAHYFARRALEAELGRRLMGVAQATATTVSPEDLALLQPGDELTRTYRNLKKHLEELKQSTGVARIYVLDAARTSLGDSKADVAIGDRYYHLDPSRLELERAFSGTAAASPLFRGHDGKLYKTGFAPLPDLKYVVAVDGAASTYENLAVLRETLVGTGIFVSAAMVALSLLFARRLVQPILQLESAAARIASGNLDEEVRALSRDEIGRVAETMESMRRQLRDRDEHMQMMLAGIAHEVRNPLAGMELYAGLLREEVTEKAARDFVLRIERELLQLKLIVAQFLDYARRPRLVFAEIEVGSLLEEVGDLVRAEATSVAVKIAVAGAPLLHGDRAQLRRALLNLAQNAVQACATDGSGEVELRATNDGGVVTLVISDNGRGIPPDQLEKIWTPFYTTKQSGTGLGLAFVRDILNDHGARIEVESTDAGTTFTLVFSQEKA